MLPLPVGTKMVRVAHFLSTTLVAAFPSRQIWTWNMGWTGEVLSIGEWTGEVYHVPTIDQPPKDRAKCCHTGSVTRHPDPSGNNDQSYTCDECGAYLKREAWLSQPPKSEHQPPIPPKIEHQPGKVFKVLPPAEIEAHAQALGWTPESRVYRSIKVPNQVWVYPAAKFIWLEHGEVRGSLYKRETDIEDSCTLLPNRTVPTDPLDQLAAEAQAEGEYKAPKPLRPAGEVAEEGILEVVARLVEDQYLGVYAPNGIVRHLREAVHAAGLSGPVNARIMADAIEKDRRARP